MAASRVSTVRAIKGPQNCFQISLRSGRLMPKARSRFPKKMRPFRSRARATTHTTGSFAMGQHLMCLRNFVGEHRYFRQLRSFKERLAQHERADVQHAAHIYEYLSEQYIFQNDSLAVLNGTLASLNLAERCGAVPETIRGYSALALGMAMSGMVRVARSYGKRAQRLAEEHGSLPEMARVRLILGVLSYGLGEWNEAEQNAQEAKLLYGRLGIASGLTTVKRWRSSLPSCEVILRKPTGNLGICSRKCRTTGLCRFARGAWPLGSSSTRLLGRQLQSI